MKSSLTHSDLTLKMLSLTYSWISGHVTMINQERERDKNFCSYPLVRFSVKLPSSRLLEREEAVLFSVRSLIHFRKLPDVLS